MKTGRRKDALSYVYIKYADDDEQEKREAATVNSPRIGLSVCLSVCLSVKAVFRSQVLVTKNHCFHPLSPPPGKPRRAGDTAAKKNGPSREDPALPAALSGDKSAVLPREIFHPGIRFSGSHDE